MSEHFITMMYGFVFLIFGLSVGAQPFVSSRGTLLGVDLPKELREREDVKRVVRNYVIQIGVLSLLFFGLTFLYPEEETRALGYFLISLVIAIILYTLPLIRGNRKLKEIKRRSGVTIPTAKIRAVDMKLSEKPYRVSGFSMKLYWIPLLLLVVTQIITAFHYPNIPGRIPYHFGIDGPDGFTEKSFRSVYGLLLTTGYPLLLIMYGVHRFTLRQKKTLNPKQTKESLIRWKLSRKYWSYYTYGLTLSTVLLVVISHVMMILPALWTAEASKIFLIFTLIFTFGLIIVTIVMGVKVGNTGSRLKLPDLPEDEAYEDEDDHWLIGGSLYYNPEDPALMVPKRVGIGTTINVGSTVGKLVMIATVLLLVGMFIAGIFLVI